MNFNTRDVHTTTTTAMLSSGERLPLLGGFDTRELSARRANYDLHSEEKSEETKRSAIAMSVTVLWFSALLMAVLFAFGFIGATAVVAVAAVDGVDMDQDTTTTTAGSSSGSDDGGGITTTAVLSIIKEEKITDLLVSMTGGKEPVLHGYDVVAYWTLDEGEEDVPGSPDFQFDLVTGNFGAYTFWFSSEENRDAFAADPYQFAPAFGGYCTFALAAEDFYTAEDLVDGSAIAPPACVHSKGQWKILDGSLYLYGCDSATFYIDELEMDLDYYIDESTKNWIDMFGALDDGPFNNKCFKDGVTEENFGLCADGGDELSSLLVPNVIAGQVSSSSSSVLAAKVTNEYGEFANEYYDWIDFETSFLVEPFKETTLTAVTAGDGEEDRFFTWSIDGGGAIDGESVTYVFGSPDEYAVTLTESDAEGDVVNEATFTAFSRYVRREIRSLTEDDLAAYQTALLTLFETKRDEGGIELYGERYLDIDYLATIHAALAGQQMCDNMHSGMGFFGQHMAMTLAFEQSLQLIDPAVSVPFWDFTIDDERAMASDSCAAAQESDDFQSCNHFIQEQAIFSADYFGTTTIQGVDESTGCPLDDEDWEGGVVEDGYFAGQLLKTDAWDFVHNSYGLLRSPWNNGNSLEVSRFNYDCNLLDADDVQSFAPCVVPAPSCSAHLTQITSSTYSTWEMFTMGLEGEPHGVLHVILGGERPQFALFDALLDAGFGEDDVVASLRKGSFPALKLMWRAYMLEAPDECSLDTPVEDCRTTCPGVVDGDVDAAYDLLENGPLLSQFSSSVEAYGDDGVLLFMQIFCEHLSLAGDQHDSASPYDTSFWPIHPALERLWQWKKIANPFTDETWPEDGECVWGYTDQSPVADDPSLCLGHAADDVLLSFDPAPELENVLGDGQDCVGYYLAGTSEPSCYTNQEFYDSADPQAAVMPYVYADFVWDHCEDLGYDFSFDGVAGLAAADSQAEAGRLEPEALKANFKRSFKAANGDFVHRDTLETVTLPHHAH